jgi:hypothetical protein
MIASDRRLLANRNNALLSTGPKTEPGKRASRNNALRHGLARPVSDDVHAKRFLEAVTGILSRRSNNFCLLDLARELAESFVDLQRVRSVRSQILFEIGELEIATSTEHERAAGQLNRIWRYEQRGLSRYRKALRAYLDFEPNGLDP